MKTTRMHLPDKQRGSFYSTALIVMMFGIFLTAVLKITPAYLDNRVIVNAMQAMVTDQSLAEMTVAELRSALMKTLNTNNITLRAEDIKLVREGGREYVDISYDTQVPLFFNISAVVSFNERFDKN